uniref:Lysyl oxidase homolog n=1 Tax=Myripristis murdjan TaxID=586833 RepID=A0A667XDV6_9TELE
MQNFVFVLICLLDALVHLGTGQQHLRARAGPWRHRIQWENNGRVYSLLSTGTQYRPPEQARRQTQLFLTAKNHFNRVQPSAMLSRPSRPGAATVNERAGVHTQLNGRGQVDVAVLGADAGQYLLTTLRPTPGARNQPPPRMATPGETAGAGFRSHGPSSNGTAPTLSIIQEFSGSGVPRGGRSPPGNDAPGPLPQAPASPVRSPDFTHSRGAPRQSESSELLPRLPTTSGWVNIIEEGGRRTPQQNNLGDSRGLPDLVPDPYYIQAASYIQRVQMYALRCAAEENCLSSVSDLDYRVLLRFPQRVKNQGTADFLPVKPRHEWEWHSCHQHYHSMEAFSNYDLLDISTGRKVAEGHKASFCLEDTSCDPGIRRRFACTAHTQGLGPGCYDTYHANIDCQWIDITDVPPGNYVLKVTVNPSQLVQESDFSNNEVRCDIRYTGTYVQARNCRITP